MLRNNISKFNCKTAILLKNNHINQEEFVKKIRKNMKLLNYEGITFTGHLYPLEITLEMKNGLFLH